VIVRRVACALLQTDAMTPSHAPRVLLGEDDAEMRTLLAEALRTEGFEVDEAEDGGRMLERAELARSKGEPAYDLVVSDVRMPAVDGFTLVGRLRAGDPATPIILMTAFGDDECSARAAELGVTMFYKPFKLDHLRAVARRIVNGEAA
jgi:DNA-binding response OmpR family regulator